MYFLRKNGFFICILAILSELFIPFILAHFYPNYNQLNGLISDFGTMNSPVQIYFKLWQFVDGILFLFSIPSFFYRFQHTSLIFSKCLGMMVAIFAIGDCICTSIFDRAMGTGLDWAGLIHEYASGLGFIAFLIGTFILIKLYLLENNQPMVIFLVSIFIISTFFMILFASPNIPILKTMNIPYRGLWQRVNLFCLYLPFLIVSIKSVISAK